MPEASDFRRLHDDENADFSAFLHTLPAADWDKPSLCTGWRVRDVVGHILYGNELKLWTLPYKLARYGFSSDRSGKAYSIARAEGRSPESLVADFDARNPWAGTCRVFPPRYTLLDRLVHHQDIRRALGQPRDVPLERTAPLLDLLPKLGSVFRSKQRMKGLRFEAFDAGWTWGPETDPPVRGMSEAIIMTALGRDQALAECEGDGIPILRTRCA
ncbi:MAG: hypothetical protein QOH64_1738 [Acidimicrobiaceae bacterium]|jgi:uncharacterized protein (TIGR03083 family)